MAERFCTNNLSDSFQYPFLRFAHSVDSLNSFISPYCVGSVVKHLRQVQLSPTHFRWAPIATILIALTFRKIDCLEWYVLLLFEICHWSFFEGIVSHIMEILVEKLRISRSSIRTVVRMIEWASWVVCAKKRWFTYVLPVCCEPVSSRNDSEDTLVWRTVGFIIIIKLWKDSLLIDDIALHCAYSSRWMFWRYLVPLVFQNRFLGSLDWFCYVNP